MTKNLMFLITFNLLSANVFNLDKAKILLSSTGLMNETNSQFLQCCTSRVNIQLKKKKKKVFDFNSKNETNLFHTTIVRDILNAKGGIIESTQTDIITGHNIL